MFALSHQAYALLERGENGDGDDDQDGMLERMAGGYEVCWNHCPTLFHTLYASFC